MSRRIGPDVSTDLDFVDDTAVLSEEIDQAQWLKSVDKSVGKVGLRIYAGKIKFMAYNHSKNIQANKGSHLERVTDFKDLSALM